MHITVYREGMSALIGGSGAVSVIAANGSEMMPNGIAASRTAADLTGFNSVRVACNNAGKVGGTGESVTLVLEYYDEHIEKWVGAGASVTIAGVGLHTGAWAQLAAGCDDVELRVTVSDESGNGGYEFQPLSVTIDVR